MKILSLNSHPPVTSSEAGSPRLYELVNNLSSDHSVVLGLLRGSISKQVAAAFSSIEIGPEKNGNIPWYRSLFHSLQGRAHCDERVRRPDYFHAVKIWIENLIETHKPDLIHVCGVEPAIYLPSKLQIPICVDFVDSLALLYARQAKQSSGLNAFRLIREGNSLAKLQREVAKRAALSIFVSPIDRDDVCDTTLRSAVIPNGVDTEYFSFGSQKREDLQILFFGVLGYEPNVDAACFLCKSVLPEIRNLGLKPKVALVGKNPAPTIIQLTTDPDVQLFADVPDIRPYLWQASLFVCPLRIGAGFKNKILVAMASGLPVLATPISLEGIDLAQNTEIFIGRDEKELAQRAVEILTNSGLRKQTATNARKAVEDRYSWRSAAQQFEALLKSIS